MWEDSYIFVKPNQQRNIAKFTGRLQEMSFHGGSNIFTSEKAKKKKIALSEKTNLQKAREKSWWDSLDSYI